MPDTAGTLAQQGGSHCVGTSIVPELTTDSLPCSASTTGRHVDLSEYRNNVSTRDAFQPAYVNMLVFLGFTGEGYPTRPVICSPRPAAPSQRPCENLQSVK